MAAIKLSSLARITDFADVPYDLAELSPEQWDTGDYVVGEVTKEPTALYQIENQHGRLVKVLAGDFVVGAFGDREATLEGAGGWRAIRDRQMHALTSAGLFGTFTSISPLLPRPLSLSYVGHVVRGGRKTSMRDFAISDCGAELQAPVVLLVGTSMSAGKTTTGAVIVHELASRGMRVVGSKLTGAGRYRDILSFRDAGADAIYDFVDAGLPSTVVSEDIFLRAIRPLIAKIGSVGPDVVVVEAGASPLEPYNGAAAIAELADHIRCRILCASDPYAVVGVRDAFGLEPDLVSGPAASTTAAVDLVHKLTGIRAINNLDPAARPVLREVLSRTLGIAFDTG